MTNKIQANKAVYFTYTVTDEHGQVTEQSEVPIGYVHGAGSGIFPKLEQALENHEKGDRIEVTIPPEDGFGHADPNLVIQEKVSNVPPQYRMIGAEAKFRNEKGEEKTFVVTSLENGVVTLDGNHPYAGKTIVFTMTVQEVRDADNEEIASGWPRDAPASSIH